MFIKCCTLNKTAEVRKTPWHTTVPQYMGLSRTSYWGLVGGGGAVQVPLCAPLLTPIPHAKNWLPLLMHSLKAKARLFFASQLIVLVLFDWLLNITLITWHAALELPAVFLEQTMSADELPPHFITTDGPRSHEPLQRARFATEPTCSTEAASARCIEFWLNLDTHVSAVSSQIILGPWMWL